MLLLYDAAFEHEHLGLPAFIVIGYCFLSLIFETIIRHSEVEVVGLVKFVGGHFINKPKFKFQIVLSYSFTFCNVLSYLY